MKTPGIWMIVTIWCRYYRRGGECLKCPSAAWVLVVMFGAAALGCVGLGYILSRKQVHLAFISIGVDYFQVRHVLFPPIISIGCLLSLHCSVESAQLVLALGGLMGSCFRSLDHALVWKILAIFASSKVDWPPSIKSFLEYLSLFNFNIEYV